MLTCQLFARSIDGVLHYRGTVEEDGSTIWSGNWRTSRTRAMQDADLAAKQCHQNRKRGQAVTEGKIGHIWRVEKELH